MFMQSQSYFGSDSGLQALLMRRYDRRQAEVHVACTSRDAEKPAVSTVRHIHAIPDVRIRSTEFGPSINATSARTRLVRAMQAPIVPVSLLSLAAYIRRHRIQIIHGTEKPRDAFYGVLLGKLTGAKSIVHMHVGYGEWQSWTARWALRNADGVVGVSRFVAKTVIAAGCSPHRVFAVVNSIDLSDSKWNPDTDGRPFRREFGIPDDAPVLGVCSRLYKWKGHGDLLDSLPAVKAQFPDVRLVIVGEDDQRAAPGEGSFRATLERQARRLGLEDNIIFTGFRSDVPQIVAAFDVYAMPTWEEPCAIAFLEAMAMKKAVVAIASGGTPELVAHGETGLLTEPKSAPALSQALITLLRDRELRQRYGEAGRKRVEQIFNPQRMCREMLDVYRAILEGSGAGID
jgi:glycosyltransferase involved in cell wall biosynthesis